MVTNAVGGILSGLQQSQVLAIRSTSRVIDEVQLRLATGLSVNDAIDNPQNFFSAQALGQRAQDLTRRLDNITQSIRSVEIAESGIEASLKILDQGEVFLEDYVDQLEQGEIEFSSAISDDLPANVTLVRPEATDFESYLLGQDFGGDPIVSANGAEIIFDSNQWKRLPFNYTVTSQTFLEFDLQIVGDDEIVGIGFDDNNVAFSGSERFFLHGTQYIPVRFAAPEATFLYDDSGDYIHYSIPVGDYFTGSYGHLTFLKDDDALPHSTVSYRNIFLREGPEQAPATIITPPAGLVEGYASIIDQITALSIDANYRGINLLQGEDQTTTFNEDGTSTITIEGIDASARGLGLSSERFKSLADVEAQIEAIGEARAALREYGRTLSSDLSVIETRESFARATINFLKAGADDLIVADQNKVGAEFLALQVRQQVQFATLAAAPASIVNLI